MKQYTNRIKIEGSPFPKEAVTIRRDKIGLFRWIWTAWLDYHSGVIVQCHYPWNIKREIIKSFRVKQYLDKHKS